MSENRCVEVFGIATRIDFKKINYYYYLEGELSMKTHRTSELVKHRYSVINNSLTWLAGKPTVVSATDPSSLDTLVLLLLQVLTSQNVCCDKKSIGQSYEVSKVYILEALLIAVIVNC